MLEKIHTKTMAQKTTTRTSEGIRIEIANERVRKRSTKDRGAMKKRYKKRVESMTRG